MRFLYLLSTFLALICTPGISTSQSSESPESVLDARALSLQMLHLHPHLDLERYALGHLQSETPLKYNSILHDEVALKAALSEISASLKAQQTAKPALPELRLDIIGETMKLQSDKRAEVLSSLSSGAIAVDNNRKVYPGFMPSSFLTLFPNAEIVSDTGISKEFASYVKARLANQDRAQIYISAYFRPVRFQQSNVVQAYLSRVKFYSDGERTKLLEEKIETRNGATLIAKSLLAEGLTLNGSPDHSTVVNGEYMMEFFPASAWGKDACSVQKPEHGHRAWLCKKPMPHDQGQGQAVERAEHKYVGGRLVQVAFFIVKPAAKPDLNAIKQNLSERFGGKFNEKDMRYRWQQQLTHYEADFTMLKGGEKPYLQIRDSDYQNLLDGKPGYEPVP